MSDLGEQCAGPPEFFESCAVGNKFQVVKVIFLGYLNHPGICGLYLSPINVEGVIHSQLRLELLQHLLCQLLELHTSRVRRVINVKATNLNHTFATLFHVKCTITDYFEHPNVINEVVVHCDIPVISRIANAIQWLFQAQ